MPEDESHRALESGIVPFCGMEDALAALSAAVGRDAPPAPPWLARLPRATRALTEAEAKAELARFGVTVPRHARATSPEGAAEAAAQLGFPVVLKGEGVAHKTEAAAVLLGLNDAGAVRAAAAAMGTSTFLDEEHVPGAVAELLIGIVADPAAGHVLTLAAGGTQTELLADHTSLLLPVSDDDIRAALARLRMAPLLAGYRGWAAAHMGALLATVRAMQDHVAAHPGQIAEVEINPLLCTPDRAVVADALIMKGDAAWPRDPSAPNAGARCWKSRSTGPRPTPSTWPPAGSWGASSPTCAWRS